MSDKEKLAKILKNGEHLTLECKESSSKIPTDVWETYSSFANTYGGTILLGIKENLKEFDLSKHFTIIGVKNPEQRRKELWDTINSDKVSSNILMDQNIQILTADEQAVMMIEVPKADYRSKPVYINGNPLKGTFRRNYEGDYHCSPEEVKAMIQDSSDSGLDGLLLENFTMDDIDVSSFRAYRNEFESHNPDHIFNTYSDLEFLRNMGGYARDRTSGMEWLTAAGLLMFGKGLSIRERFSSLSFDYLNQSNIQLGQRWSDRIVIDGSWENNLYTFVRKVLPKLTESLKKPFTISGFVREDDSKVHQAIREAVINMIIHANYHINGTLKIIKSDNSFYFSNPGNLKLPVSEIFKGGHTSARNPYIQQMFRMIGLCDNIGSGIPTILKIWKENNWQEPDLFDNLQHQTVELRLSMSDSISPDTQKKLVGLLGSDLYSSLTEIQLRVLGIAATEERVTVTRLQPLLKLDPSEILSLLSALSEQKILLAHQQHRSAYFTLNQNYQPANQKSLQKEQTAQKETDKGDPDVTIVVNPRLSKTDQEILKLFSRYDALTFSLVQKEISSINTIPGASKAINRLVDKQLIGKRKNGRILEFYLIKSGGN